MLRGTFRGPSTNYQFTDYPTVTAAAFVTTDGGLESTMDLALPFTDTPNEAQRLANIALEKNRSQITITGSFGLNAFSLQVGDNVNITNTRFGWTDKLFEVVAWSLSVEDYQLNVNLVLRETTTTTYDEVQNIAVFESDNTNLPGALGETSVTIAAGSVGTTELADDAVNSDKIADDAVNTDQIADDAVNTDRIATGTASKITFASFGPARTEITKNASSTIPNWQDVVSNEITGIDSDSKLLVTWNLVVDVAGTNAFKKFFVTLRNGDTVVWQTWPNNPDYNSGDDAMGVQDRATFSGSYIDTNPGSSETYKVSVTRGSGFSDSIFVERASVTITELRKPD